MDADAMMTAKRIFKLCLQSEATLGPTMTLSEACRAIYYHCALHQAALLRIVDSRFSAIIFKEVELQILMLREVHIKLGIVKCRGPVRLSGD